MLSLEEIWAAEESNNTVKRCRYPLTDDVPHYFCGETTDGRSYCPAHDKSCHAGQGKPWQGLAGMMANVEQSILPVRGDNGIFERDTQPPIDEVFAEAADHFDKPMGLMGRT